MSEFQGHVGDANPLGLVELESSGELVFSSMDVVEMLAATRGGGVVELKLDRRREDTGSLLEEGLLVNLQRAIVEHPDFKFETAAVKKFLQLDRKPEIYKHPERTDDGIEEVSEKLEVATAEGPAISAEPELGKLLEELLGKTENRVADYQNHRKEMLHLGILRLFLDSPLDTQRELLQTVSVVKKKSGGDVGDVDIDALVFELALIVAHSMF